MRPQRDIPNAGASLLGVENVALGRPLELVHFESVPDAGLVREVARLGRLALELLSKLPDEDPQVVRLLDVRGPPDFLSNWRCVTTRPAYLMSVVRSLYSVGVKWTSSFPRKTSRRVRSTRRSPTLNTASSFPEVLSATCLSATRIRAKSSSTLNGLVK